MKAFVVIFLGVLSVIANTALAETSPPYQTTYLAAIENFERGEFQAASESFFRAIKLAPDPVTQPHEYLPYIYLSAVYFKMGHIRDARDALIESQVFGVAAKTATGKLLLDRYATKIMSAPLDEPKVAALPQPGQFNSQVLPLADHEVGSTSDHALKRCASPAKLSDNKLPWYFYYELGIDLMEAGDAEHALDCFVQGANILQDSKRGKRTYGMWFVDYLPYYQIALANTKLGNWENARAAIRVSEDFGEFTSADPGYDAFIRLDQLITNQLKNSDS